MNNVIKFIKTFLGLPNRISIGRSCDGELIFVHGEHYCKTHLNNYCEDLDCIRQMLQPRTEEKEK